MGLWKGLLGDGESLWRLEIDGTAGDLVHGAIAVDLDGCDDGLVEGEGLPQFVVEHGVMDFFEFAVFHFGDMADVFPVDPDFDVGPVFSGEVEDFHSAEVVSDQRTGFGFDGSWGVEPVGEASGGVFPELGHRLPQGGVRVGEHGWLTAAGEDGHASEESNGG